MIFRLREPANFWIRGGQHRIFPPGTLIQAEGAHYCVLNMPNYWRFSINTISVERLSPLQALAAAEGP